MTYRATQDRWVMVESANKMWFTGEGNGKPLQYSWIENPMNSMKSNSRKKEETEPRQKQHPVVDVTGDGSKVQCCKEQYCVGTWNVLSMNQGKLEAVKQDMTRIWKYLTWNSRILGLSELRRTGQDGCASDRTRNLVMFQMNCTWG